MADLSFCSQYSAQKKEPLAGTAPASTTVWILLEHSGVWTPKPLQCPEFSKPVRKQIESWLYQIPDSRFQLIRKKTSCSEQTGLKLMVAYVSEETPFIFSFTLENLQAILDVDVPAELESKKQNPNAIPPEDPIVLVCTHGKRDRCCSKWGLPFFNALLPMASKQVWQTSHLGGHRFAATALVLPHGFCYGRLGVQDADGVLQSLNHKKISLIENFRGWTGFPAPIQSAHIFLLKEIQTSDFKNFTMKTAFEIGRHTWEITFENQEKELFKIVSKKKNTGISVYSSCFDEEKQIEKWESAWLL